MLCVSVTRSHYCWEYADSNLVFCKPSIANRVRGFAFSFNMRKTTRKVFGLKMFRACDRMRRRHPFSASQVDKVNPFLSLFLCFRPFILQVKYTMKGYTFSLSVTLSQPATTHLFGIFNMKM